MTPKIATGFAQTENGKMVSWIGWISLHNRLMVIGVKMSALTSSGNFDENVYLETAFWKNR